MKTRLLPLKRQAPGATFAQIRIFRDLDLKREEARRIKHNLNSDLNWYAESARLGRLTDTDRIIYHRLKTMKEHGFL